MLTTLALIACILAAAGAVRIPGLLGSGILLAATSALLALALYLLDAPVVAIVELSVGAGLVAVLFTFSVVGAGGGAYRARPALPRWIAVPVAAVPILLLAFALARTRELAHPALSTLGFVEAMWSQRGLDALGQVVLLLVGAISVKVLVGGLPRENPVEVRDSTTSELHDEVAA